eukprot:Lithocolla_globosa_v1_NODE_705_length_3413_cov_7.772186.p4 type:complete len:183 gc:universal NODE_705_length_3413_cov_7.772186:582-34(-)
MELNPCVVVQSSQSKFHFWYWFPHVRSDTYTELARLLAQHLGADVGSARRNQVGAFPGFYNMKPKYSPSFPKTKIFYVNQTARGRLVMVAHLQNSSLASVERIPTKPPDRFGIHSNIDRSKRDFYFIARYIQMIPGKGVHFYVHHLKKSSEKFGQRFERDNRAGWIYLYETVRSAMRAVGAQ